MPDRLRRIKAFIALDEMRQASEPLIDIELHSCGGKLCNAPDQRAVAGIGTETTGDGDDVHGVIEMPEALSV